MYESTKVVCASLLNHQEEKLQPTCMYFFYHDYFDYPSISKSCNTKV